MSVQWLVEKVPGFGTLLQEDLAAIFNFTFLWSLFEAQIMGTAASTNRISAKVDEWNAAGTLDADLYDAELAYFRERYFANGAFTYRFERLNLRRTDQPVVVRSVIDGSNNAPEDRMLAILLIVWRFRNNLFHGEKWAYQFQGQLANFTNANAVLMRLIERHGQLVA